MKALKTVQQISLSYLKNMKRILKYSLCVKCVCVYCGWQYLQMGEAVLEEDVPVVEEKLFLANTQQTSHQGIQSLRKNRAALASQSSSYFESQTFLGVSYFF